MLPSIPNGWTSPLSAESAKPYYLELQRFLDRERQTQTIFPPEPDVFSALALTPLDRVRVLILGQDPYPGEGLAHGLSFSVPPGAKKPGSLVNIFKELKDDVGCDTPKDGSLIPWAHQGALMLNAVLTVRAHKPNSHKGKGWETFTDAIISAVNAKGSRVVFVLWGRDAQAKKTLITNAGLHTVLEAPHPSNMAARKGFFGSKPFSKTNDALKEKGLGSIDWRLPTT